MRKGSLFTLLLASVLLMSCSQDPVPTATTGNPRIDLAPDSVVMLGQSGEVPLIFEMAVTPGGTFYAAGVELRSNNTWIQGNLWKLQGDTWISALDAATQSELATVSGVASSPSGAVWAVGSRKEESPIGYTMILRGFDDNWMPVEPESFYEARNLTVAGEDDVWFYGQSDIILHYHDNTWEYTMLPDSLSPDGESLLWVESVAVDGGYIWALVKVGLEPAAGRILLQWIDNAWTPRYAEGEVDTSRTHIPTSTINRDLRQLFMDPFGGLYAIGGAVYRWAGESFVQEFRPRDGGTLLTGMRAHSGQMLVGGAAMSAGWSGGQGWYHVHMAYDTRPTIQALALHDTVAVLAVSDTLSSAHTLLRGPISRVTPP